jgi:hypothetical protein
MSALTIGAPVDVLARQALSLAEQSKAMRAQLDALDRQVDCLLETIRLLQPPAPDPAVTRPRVPPVFGRKAPDVPFETDAPAAGEPMTRAEVLAHA